MTDKKINEKVEKLIEALKENIKETLDGEFHCGVAGSLRERINLMEKLYLITKEEEKLEG